MLLSLLVICKTACRWQLKPFQIDVCSLLWWKCFIVKIHYWCWKKCRYLHIFQALFRRIKGTVSLWLLLYLLAKCDKWVPLLIQDDYKLVTGNYFLCVISVWKMCIQGRTLYRCICTCVHSVTIDALNFKHCTAK